MEISILNKRELQCADQFAFLVEKMLKLTHAERQRVYHRLAIIYGITEDECRAIDNKFVVWLNHKS